MHPDISAPSTQGPQLERGVLCKFFAQISAEGLFPSHLFRFLHFFALSRIEDASYLRAGLTAMILDSRLPFIFASWQKSISKGTALHTLLGLMHHWRTRSCHLPCRQA